MEAEILLSALSEAHEQATHVKTEEKVDMEPIDELKSMGCNVFDQCTDKLDWSSLAGYTKVKRQIEDTVMMTLTHGEVYNEIMDKTRVKKDSSRAKLVLFQGPPGCGKTTAARIIASQVDCTLVYVPLEAVTSRFYGESE